MKNYIYQFSGFLQRHLKDIDDSMKKVKVLCTSIDSSEIVGSSQNGFISGRYIVENTRLAYDIVNFTEKANITG